MAKNTTTIGRDNNGASRTTGGRPAPTGTKGNFGYGKKNAVGRIAGDPRVSYTPIGKNPMFPVAPKKIVPAAVVKPVVKAAPHVKTPTTSGAAMRPNQPISVAQAARLEPGSYNTATTFSNGKTYGKITVGKTSGGGTSVGNWGSSGNSGRGSGGGAGTGNGWGGSSGGTSRTPGTRNK